MPKNLLKENVPVGSVIYEWAVKEYEEYDRSKRWYWIMGLIGAALVVYSIFATNYLFALVIVLFGLVLYLHELQEPMDIYFAITETGIIIGTKYYRFSELQNFWIVYAPPEVKNLYFSMGGLVRHRMQIPLLDYDPRPIREYLNQFLTEDLEQEDEPLSDRLARVLKIH